MEKTYVGIDVSKHKLDCAIYEGGFKQFENTKDGIESLKKWLSENTKEATVVIESTGHYHWLVCLELSAIGFCVKLINPLITKKYQKSSIRDAKSDKVDARRLADIGRLESDLPDFFDTRETLKNKRYQALLIKLQDASQKLKSAYRSAVEAATNIDIELDLSDIEATLEVLKTAITHLKKIIEKNASALAQKVSDEIRGISLFQATIITQAVEGKNLKNRDQLTAFFGLDIRARQSGRWLGNSKLSKRGNPFYRKILFQIGWSLWRNNPDFTQVYERLRSNGKHFYTCLIAVARKFLRFFFHHFLDHSL